MISEERLQELLDQADEDLKNAIGTQRTTAVEGQKTVYALQSMAASQIVIARRLTQLVKQGAERA